jgi:hypothetical protein
VRGAGEALPDVQIIKIKQRFRNDA